eukprot:8515752-Karenia_brevis.AAC.1
MMCRRLMWSVTARRKWPLQLVGNLAALWEISKHHGLIVKAERSGELQGWMDSWATLFHVKWLPFANTVRRLR